MASPMINVICNIINSSEKQPHDFESRTLDLANHRQLGKLSNCGLPTTH